MYSFNHGSKRFRPLQLKGVTSVVGCVKCVQLPGKKKQQQQQTNKQTNKQKTGLPIPMSSFEFYDSPLAKGSKTDDPPFL